MRLLPPFRLEIRTNRDEESTTIRIDVVDRADARRQAAAAVASAFGRPGEFVHFDEARGRFTVGAGLWSRSGYYRLEPDGSPAGAPARN
jgi:hypothetical protein